MDNGILKPVLLLPLVPDGNVSKHAHFTFALGRGS